MRANELKNYKPFNEFFYRGCLYHGLVSGYEGLGVDKQYWLVNCVSTYVYNEKERVFKINDVDLFSKRDFELITGVRQIVRKKTKDLLSVIKNSIDNGMPIIVATDCFYLSQRKDSYRKNHRGHFTLVYGYDENRRVFKTIDHLYYNSHRYMFLEESMDEFIKANEQYQFLLQGKNSFSTIQLQKLRDPYIKIDNSYFFKRIKLKKAFLNNGYQNLGRFFSLIKRELNRDVVNYEDVRSIAELSFAGRWQRVVFKNQMEYLFNGEQINDIVEELIDCFTFISGACMKMSIAKIEDKRATAKIEQKLDKALFLEKEVIKFLIGG